MKSISVLEFRQWAKAVLSAVGKGQSVVLTYRGKPVARLEPIDREAVESDDPFYRLHELAAKSGKSLTNSEMDQLVHGMRMN